MLPPHLPQIHSLGKKKSIGPLAHKTTYANDPVYVPCTPDVRKESAVYLKIGVLFLPAANGTRARRRRHEALSCICHASPQLDLDQLNCWLYSSSDLLLENIVYSTSAPKAYITAFAPIILLFFLHHHPLPSPPPTQHSTPSCPLLLPTLSRRHPPSSRPGSVSRSSPSTPFSVLLAVVLVSLLSFDFSLPHPSY